MKPSPLLLQRAKGRLGCTEPRICTPPLRPLTPDTSDGFSVIEFARDVLGIELIPWQKALLIRALEKRPDGTYRFRTVVVLVARQCGKSTLSQVLALWWLYVCGCRTVLGTAQDLDTATEVWDGCREIIDSIPELAELTDTPILTNGKQAIRLYTGEKYRVKAANRRAGRGLTGNRIILDELREHQDWLAWAALTKTQMAVADAQNWCFSNAGDMTSVVLRHLRKLGHRPLGDPDGICAADQDAAAGLLPDGDELDEIAGRLGDEFDDLDVDDLQVDEDDLGIFEWSAPPGCARTDRDAWAQADPSMGYTALTERTIASACRTDPEWVFRTEVLCQWSEGGLTGPFPAGAWEACQAVLDDAGRLASGERIDPDGRVEAALEVSWDRSTAYVTVAGCRLDGMPQVEVAARRAGTAWVVPWFTEKESRTGLRVVVRHGSPGASLTPDLEAAGVEVVEWKGPDVPDGCGRFFDAVVQGKVRVSPDAACDLAAGTARTKLLSNGAWMWDGKASPHDIAPLIGLNGAWWLLDQADPVPAPPPPAPRVARVTRPRNDIATRGF